MQTKNPLIIALDVDSPRKALNLVRKLKVTGAAFKVGYELFCAAGPRIVDRIIAHDVRVFLDLKFHDIPNTVKKAAATVTKMGCWMFNVHASGGAEMMRVAKEESLDVAKKYGYKPPLVLAVTVLTSLSELDFLGVGRTMPDQVLHLAQLAQHGRLDGVVASAQEASLLKKACGAQFCLVTPGIRLPMSPADDQKRTLTPKEAMQAGSHYMVMGRPITESPRPLRTIETILSSLQR